MRLLPAGTVARHWHRNCSIYFVAQDFHGSGFLTRHLGGWCSANAFSSNYSSSGGVDALVWMEKAMPHVTVKMFTGRSEGDKKRLAERVTLALVNTLGSSEDSISVAIEDVSPDEWTEKVYDPEIAGRPQSIYKKPGYKRF